MTGRFDLDWGEDYGFFPRRAKEVAEGAGGGGGAQQGVVTGPYQTDSGVNYWIGKLPSGQCTIGFDIDADPEPDIFVSLNSFLSNPTVDQQSRDEVAEQAGNAGCQL